MRRLLHLLGCVAVLAVLAGGAAGPVGAEDWVTSEFHGDMQPLILLSGCDGLIAEGVVAPVHEGWGLWDHAVRHNIVATVHYDGTLKRILSMPDAAPEGYSLRADFTGSGIDGAGGTISVEGYWTHSRWEPDFFADGGAATVRRADGSYANATVVRGASSIVYADAMWGNWPVLQLIATSCVFADVSPPVLTVPATVAVTAASTTGATASYAVTAADDVDPSPVVACTPPSGSVFPVGDTTVNCSATDASGNKANESFTVRVTQPPTIVQSIRVGQTLRGTVTWTATPSAAVKQVVFALDANAITYTDTTAPYAYLLDTTRLANGAHELGLTVTLLDGTIVWQPYQIGTVTIANTSSAGGGSTGGGSVPATPTPAPTRPPAAPATKPQPTKPLRLLPRGFALTAKTATAGKTFGAAMYVIRSDTGKRITGIPVDAKATIAGKPLALARRGWHHGAATATWRIPKTARGKTLAGSLTVTYHDATLTKKFTANIR